MRTSTASVLLSNSNKPEMVLEEAETERERSRRVEILLFTDYVSISLKKNENNISFTLKIYSRLASNILNLTKPGTSCSVHSCEKTTHKKIYLYLNYTGLGVKLWSPGGLIWTKVKHTCLHLSPLIQDIQTLFLTSRNNKTNKQNEYCLLHYIVWR